MAYAAGASFGNTRKCLLKGNLVAAYIPRIKQTRHWFVISYLSISLLFITSVFILSINAVHTSPVQARRLTVGALQIYPRTAIATDTCGDARMTSPLGDAMTSTTEPWWCGYLYYKVQSLFMVTVLLVSAAGVVWFIHTTQSKSKLKR